MKKRSINGNHINMIKGRLGDKGIDSDAAPQKKKKERQGETRGGEVRLSVKKRRESDERSGSNRRAAAPPAELQLSALHQSAFSPHFKLRRRLGKVGDSQRHFLATRE